MQAIMDGWRKWKRYARFSLQVLWERAQGLDFTLPEAGKYTKTSSAYNGYYKTAEGHMQAVLEVLPISYKENSFLDIGCGKGAALRAARAFPFRRVCGIEIDPELTETAQNNMYQLGLEDVECVCANALSYDGYGDFDVFFLFNPFSYEVLEEVLGRILDSLLARPRRAYILYHHPVHHALLDRLGFIREQALFDKCKGYETYIYSAPLPRPLIQPGKTLREQWGR